MTTPQEIEAQIQREDIQPYLNSVYDGELSDSLIDQFRVAIMLVPVTVHKFSMRDIYNMVNRRTSEITVRELGMILNTVFAIPWANMYESVEEGIEKTTVFERIREEYNKTTAAFQRKCDAKMQRLLKLSGITHSTPMNNGMKIIPNS